MHSRQVFKQLSVAVLTAASVALGGAAAQAITIPLPCTVSGGAGVLNVNSQHCTVGDFYIEAFWAQNIGSASGGFTNGHFHPSTGEEQHFNLSTDLQGFFIQRSDLADFSFSAIDYIVRSSSPAIPGYSSSSASLLFSETFNPTASVVSQFTAFGVGGGGASGTLSVTGFDDVSRVFISSSSSVFFDNPVVGAAVVAAVPEPATALLVGGGLLAIGWARRRNRGV
jgi:hypothetical protein